MSSIAEKLKQEVVESGPKPFQITVRQLISRWNAKRRGYWVVWQIGRELEEVGLVTSPPFSDGWIDNTVTVHLVEQSMEPDGLDVVEESDQADADPVEVSLLVGSLTSANLGVSHIGLSDTLEVAQAMMMRFDYSQLAVMSGIRDLRGAVTWESIAQAKIHDSQAALRDAVVPADLVRSTDDLLDVIPRVIGNGYVFVQAPDKQIVGIVTTADLSQQFAVLAKPFFVLAEIERRLRRIIDRSFDSENLRAVVDPGDFDRVVQSANDLTIGEYQRLIEQPSSWAKFRWSLDRVQFVQALDEVRTIRNDVMHFSPDPLDADQIRALENFLNWVRKLDHER